MREQSRLLRDEITHGEIRKILKKGSVGIHFVGIGGVSMYSLARLFLDKGARVSGSDRVENKRTEAIATLGAKVSLGHSIDNLSDADILVYSHAISRDNPELLFALRQGIPTISRDKLLGAIMSDYYTRIGVSGSHGKSTTTSMLDCIFRHCMTDPTTLSGADLDTGEPIIIGSKGLLIYEACEYKDSFLSFLPTVAIGLNLELDHTDYFENINSLKSSFAKALGRAESYALINGDDENLIDIKSRLSCPTITFGVAESNDYRYSITSFFHGGVEFSLSKHGQILGSFRLNIPGAFNVNNAVAAIVTALEYGLDAESVARAVENFRGVPGRLEYVGDRFGRAVYLDYAHHPTEITAGINALRLHTKGGVTVIFKPHTFSRTKALWQEFCCALSLADHLILTDIFPAREDPIEGITSERLAEEIGGNAVRLSDEDVLTYIDLYSAGAIVIMGAGGLDEIKKQIITS